jgi:hypothetical protein
MLAYYQWGSVLLLLVAVGFSVGAVWQLIRVAVPTVTMPRYEWQEVATLEQFEDAAKERSPEGQRKAESPAELESRWKRKRASAVANERHDGTQGLLFAMAGLAVSLPLYAWHHGVLRRSREGEGDS